MRLILPVILLGCACAALGQPANLSADERLSKKISARLKMTPIKKALRELEKEAGVGLDVVSTMDDLKVTVLCKDESASLILSKLADVLGAEWQADGQIYRLRMDKDLQDQRKAYVEAEERLLRKRVEDAVIALTKEQSSDAAPAESGGAQSAPKGNLSRLFASLKSAQLASFWRGDTKTFASMSPAQQGNAPIAIESTRVFARYDPVLHTLDLSPGSSGPLSRPQITPYKRPAPGLLGMPWAKGVGEWGTGVSAEDRKDKRFGSPVSGVEPRQPHETPLSMADNLDRFFANTGIAVVADAFRISSVTPSSAMPAAEWLQGQAQQNGHFLKVTDGVVQLRHGGFWRLRKFEIPELALEDVEKLNQKEALTLGQLGAFASKLTAEQFAGLRAPGWAIAVDLEPFRVASPVISLVASLSPAQRSRATQGGLPAVQLPPAMQARFAEVLLRGALEGKGAGPYVALVVVGDLRQLGLIVEESGRPEEKTFRVVLGMSSSQGVIYTGTSQVRAKSP